MQELGMLIPTSVFLMFNIANLSEHLLSGLSARTWWNNQRMGRITTMTACFFGFLDILLKRLRISDTVFEITKKDQPSSSDENVGRFIFNKSPIFIPGTAILFIEIIALVTTLWRWQQPLKSERAYGLGEVFCSAYLVLCYLPILKGLFAKGKYGIPLPTIFKASLLAVLFVGVCNSSLINWLDSFGRFIGIYAHLEFWKNIEWHQVQLLRISLTSIFASHMLPYLIFWFYFSP